LDPGFFLVALLSQGAGLFVKGIEPSNSKCLGLFLSVTTMSTPGFFWPSRERGSEAGIGAIRKDYMVDEAVTKAS
jgi:hypothetical protein